MWDGTLHSYIQLQLSTIHLSTKGRGHVLNEKWEIPHPNEIQRPGGAADGGDPARSVGVARAGGVQLIGQLHQAHDRLVASLQVPRANMVARRAVPTLLGERESSLRARALTNDSRRQASCGDERQADRVRGRDGGHAPAVAC
jgi:hypothetical protein